MPGYYLSLPPSTGEEADTSTQTGRAGQVKFNENTSEDTCLSKRFICFQPRMPRLCNKTCPALALEGHNEMWELRAFRVLCGQRATSAFFPKYLTLSTDLFASLRTCSARQLVGACAPQRNDSTSTPKIVRPLALLRRSGRLRRHIDLASVQFSIIMREHRHQPTPEAHVGQL